MKKLKQLKPRFNMDLPRYADLREMVNGSAQRFANKTAFIIKHKKSKSEVEYEYITFEMFRDQINQFGAGLLAAGMEGHTIAISGKNSYPWLQSYFAVVGGLGTCVPLDNGLPYEELESSLARSYSDTFIFDPAKVDMVEKLKAEGKTQVKTWIAMSECGDYPTIAQYMEEGKKALEAGDDSYLKLPINPQEVKILLFTSGTTSMAKAVMLSHDNIISNVYSLMRCEDIRSTDVNMAFLPYHHTFGSTGQFCMIAGGAATAYCDGLKYLQKNIVEYKVSLFFCVPLLIESIYKKVMQTVKKEGKEGKVQFARKLSKFLLKFGIDVRRKLFKQVLDQLGGELRFVISGAAAIDPEAIEGFNDFGIKAVQGYGMTEAAPVITAENHFEQEYGSIGRPIEGVEVDIFEPNEEGIGELIARGPNVMHGYFENEEATAETLVDGWLHTGDLAYISEGGYVYICGRKKNVIVLKNGKNVYPEEIEVLIANLPYTEEVMVFGQSKGDDERDIALSTKIVYKADVLKEAGLTDADEINAYIKKDIDEINATLPVYKQITRVITTDQPMVKTTTGKVKRYEETKNL